ncbi:hypothetical protein JW835_15090 [bacterium]|nr:hypothetical protein [bacterium]
MQTPVAFHFFLHLCQPPIILLHPAIIERIVIEKTIFYHTILLCLSPDLSMRGANRVTASNSQKTSGRFQAFSNDSGGIDEESFFR